MGASAPENRIENPGPTTKHLKPTGTIFVLALFVATFILLWVSVYLILLSRGVTV